MIVLHPHQQKFIDELRASLKKNRHVLGQAATGFGKTVVASYMTKSALEKDWRTYFVVHRLELLEQTSNTFTRMGIEHGWMKAGKYTHPQRLVQIMSIDTLKKKLDEVEPPDFMIFDEVHHLASKGQSKVYEWAISNGAVTVGLTATPWRLDRKGFTEYFKDMVSGPSVGWLIENNFLSRYKVFTAPALPDMTDIKISGGDFQTSAVEKIMNDKILYGCAVENWLKLAQGKRTLAFCPTIAVSEQLVQNFIDQGVKASHLDANTPKLKRKTDIQRFADGEIDILSNCGLFGEGFDLSAIAGRDVPVQAVLIYRPTMSLSLHLQILGRALRPKPDHALILDHAGNCVRHGFPDDDYDWSLKPRKKKKAAAMIAAVICPECHCTHHPAKICPHCGHVYEGAPRDDKENMDGDLVELKKEDAGHMRKKLRGGQYREELAACNNIEDLRVMQKRNGYKSGFVFKIAKEKGWR